MKEKIKELFELAGQYVAVEVPALKAQKKDDFIAKLTKMFPIEISGSSLNEKISEFCRNVQEAFESQKFDSSTNKTHLAFLQLVFKAKEQINKAFYQKLYAVIGGYLFVQKNKYAILFLDDAAAENADAQKQRVTCYSNLAGLKESLNLDMRDQWRAFWSVENEEKRVTATLNIELLKIDFFEPEWYLGRQHFKIIESLSKQYHDLSLQIFYTNVIYFIEKYQFDYEAQAEAEDKDSNKRNFYFCQAGVVAATAYKFLRILIKMQNSTIPQDEKDRFTMYVTEFFKERKKYYETKANNYTALQNHYRSQAELAVSTCKVYLELLVKIYSSPLNAVNDQRYAEFFKTGTDVTSIPVSAPVPIPGPNTGLADTPSDAFVSPSSASLPSAADLYHTSQSASNSSSFVNGGYVKTLFVKNWPPRASAPALMTPNATPVASSTSSTSGAVTSASQQYGSVDDRFVDDFFSFGSRVHK